MSNFADRLKKSQGEAKTFPKLTIDKRVDLKESEGEIFFSYYDSEKKESVFIKNKDKKPASISGILIGQAMQLLSYSDNLGTKGGTYQSGYYLNNNNIVLFAPEKSGFKKVIAGSLTQIEDYLRNAKAKDLHKKRVFFLLTKSGFVAISTNLSIAIDQFPKFKDKLATNLIVLTPKVLSPTDDCVSKKCREILGKFITKNPPKFADISVGDTITDKIATELNLEPICDMWDEWKEFATKGGDTSLVEEEKTPEQQPEIITNSSKNDEDMPF